MRTTSGLDALTSERIVVIAHLPSGIVTVTVANKP